MLALKVPFFTDAEFDSAVAELLRGYARWKGAPAKPPINVEEIVEAYLHLDYGFDDLSKFGSDVLGAAWFDAKRVRIDSSLEAGIVEGRLAFTVAHEIGHWQLHRPLWAMDQVTLPLFSMGPEPKAAEPAIVCRTSNAKDKAEYQANQFAARLLMPAAEMRAAMRSAFGDQVPCWAGLNAKAKANELDGQLALVATEVLVAGRFTNVSNEAMRRRLVQMNLVEDRANPQKRLV